MSEQRPCIVCRHDLDTSDPQTCVRCLGRVRSWLADLRAWYPALHDEMLGRAGAASFPPGGRGSSELALIGGDALVMTAPGSDGGRDDDTRHDPVPVRFLLGQWAADWHDRLRGEDHPVTMPGLVDWIAKRLDWAAQHHPAFREIHDDIRDLRFAVGAAVAESDPIDRGGKIPCPDCGQPLIRRFAEASPCDHDGPHCDHSHPKSARWTCRGSNTCGCDQGGRSDDWACSSRACGRVLTEAEYWLAVRAEYERAGGEPMDDLVTWLRAQIDADEHFASRAGSREWSWGASEFVPGFDVFKGVFATEPDEGIALSPSGYDDWDWTEARGSHIAHHDPARVLADVEVKRAIIDHHECVPDPEGDPLGDLCAICTETGPDAQGWPCRTLRLIASPYRDRDGYRDEWAPDA